MCSHGCWGFEHKSSSLHGKNVLHPSSSLVLRIGQLIISMCGFFILSQVVVARTMLNEEEKGMKGSRWECLVPHTDIISDDASNGWLSFHAQSSSPIDPSASLLALLSCYLTTSAALQPFDLDYVLVSSRTQGAFACNEVHPFVSAGKLSPFFFLKRVAGPLCLNTNGVLIEITAFDKIKL